jgi:hypothetical protein
LTAFDSQPTADNDTFVITDGTNTETYAFKSSESAPFDVAIGATAADTLANLIQAINDDSSYWSAVDTVGLDAYFASAYTAQGVIYRTAVSTANDRVYGVSTTATQIKVVDFQQVGDQDYSIASGTEANLPSSDPAAKRFGFGRTKANLVTNEAHPVAEDVTVWLWDTDDELWRQVDNSAITAGAGLARSGNTISADLDTDADETSSGSSGGSSGLEFDTSGNSGQLRARVSTTGAIGRQSDGLGVRVETTNPALAITGNELDVKYQTTKGLASDGSGLYVKVDTTTINYDGSGNLEAVASPEAERIENDLAVNEAIAVGDAVHFETTNDRISESDADNDSQSRVIGVATTAQATVGQNATIVSHGVAADTISSATVGTPYYLQSGGGIGTSIPSGAKRVVQVGIAKNADDLWVRVLDFGKKAA